MARKRATPAPPDPPDPALAGIDFREVLAGYFENIAELRSQRVIAEKQQSLHPDNCAWGTIIVKCIDQENRVRKDLRDTLGIGRVTFIGQDGFLYNSKQIESGRDRDPSPRQAKHVQEKRDAVECDPWLIDKPDFDDWGNEL